MWDKVLAFDQQALLSLNWHGSDFADWMFWFISQRWIWLPLYILVIYMIYRRVGVKQLLAFIGLSVLTIVCIDLVCNFFKEFVPKFRPTHNPDIHNLVYTAFGYRGGYYGTVSAHSAIAFFIASFTARVIHKPTFSWILYIWATAVAYSRIYLGVHFPMDIIFGFTLGSICGIGTFKLFISQKFTNWVTRRKKQEIQEIHNKI